MLILFQINSVDSLVGHSVLYSRQQSSLRTRINKPRILITTSAARVVQKHKLRCIYCWANHLVWEGITSCFISIRFNHNIYPEKYKIWPRPLLFLPQLCSFLLFHLILHPSVFINFFISLHDLFLFLRNKMIKNWGVIGGITAAIAAGVYVMWGPITERKKRKRGKNWLNFEIGPNFIGKLYLPSLFLMFCSYPRFKCLLLNLLGT